ncbi:MAG TPA: hypothetical protein VIM98_09495 [Dyella sp.]|uniref:hypothetical protein n=1 Tax=Dyella sp. TaxID=1869338 RepID=UPI002F951D7B
MKATAGGVIAIILLAIYVYLIVDGCIIVGSKGASGLAFNDVMSQTLSVIGGLISALVIAELAVTKPGETPVARILSPDASDRSKSVLKWISGLYLVVWLLAGLTAFLVGMVNPNQLQPLTSVGQSWFGLAVAAAYAYFGLKPD